MNGSHCVHWRVFLLAGTAALSFPVSAYAEAPAPADVSAARGTDDGPAEIIVSARRRTETAQTTPVAVTAIAPSRLEGAAAVSIADLQGAAPSVMISAAPTGAAAANASIRGIGFADIEKSFDPAVGVNVDGVYIGTSTGQLLDFFDISSIEILRGPQGTLFGRNTIAGVINVRRSRPTGEWGAKLEVGYGSYGHFTGKAVINAPLVKDMLAVKAFEMHDEATGYYHDLAGNKRGGYNNENFGLAFALTPSSTFDALLTLEQQNQVFEPVTSPLTVPGDAFCIPAAGVVCGPVGTLDPYVDNPGFAAFGRYRGRGATLEMNWNAGPVKFNSTTSYRHSKEAQGQDFSTAGLYVTSRFQKYHQFSQEFRAAGNLFSGFDYVAGLYYFESRYHIVQPGIVFGSPTPAQDTVGTSKSLAGYVDINWEILPKVRISAGGRYTKDKKSLVTAIGDVPLAPRASASWNKFTPKLGVDFRPTDTIMLYGVWSKGYRSGGFNGRGQTAFSVSTPYAPENVDSYEVGLKTEFFDRMLTFNIDGYYTQYKNIQQSTTVSAATGIGNETIVTNAAKAKIKGIEADVMLRPMRRMTLSSSFGYTDAGFRNFITRQPVAGYAFPVAFDLSNVNLIFAPKVTFSANIDYAIPVGEGDSEVKLNAGYRYISRFDSQVAGDPATVLPAIITPDTVVDVARNDPRLRVDRQNLIDASISYIWPLGANGPKARVTAFGRNLLDDRGHSFAFNVAAYPVLWGFGAAREPRVFGGQFGLEF